MEKAEPTVSIAEGSANSKPSFADSQAQNMDPTVETSEESYQTTAQSGSPKNGSPTIPLLLEGHVSLMSQRPLYCNQRSGSTTGVLGKYANVKPTREALITSLCRPKCSWGLIWRKKKLDLNTWEDFISRKVILSGNPSMRPLKPTCHYCSKLYDSDLMYIQCETCPSWYHADAVGLKVKQISDLVGFKCCKCRKIRKPTCPYSDPEPRRILEVNKLQVKASKVEKLAAGPCPGSVQEQKDLLPSSAVETPHTVDDDTLHLSSSQVRPQPENQSTAIVSSPKAISKMVLKAGIR